MRTCGGLVFPSVSLLQRVHFGMRPACLCSCGEREAAGGGVRGAGRPHALSSLLHDVTCIAILECVLEYILEYVLVYVAHSYCNNTRVVHVYLGKRTAYRGAPTCTSRYAFASPVADTHSS